MCATERTIDVGGKSCVSQVGPCAKACRVDDWLPNPLGDDILELTGDFVLEVAGELYDSSMKDVVRVCADDSRAAIRFAQVLRHVANTMKQARNSNRLVSM